MSEYVEVKRRTKGPTKPKLHSIEITGSERGRHLVLHHHGQHPSAEHEYASKPEVLAHLEQHLPDVDQDDSEVNHGE